MAGIQPPSTCDGGAADRRRDVASCAMGRQIIATVTKCVPACGSSAAGATHSSPASPLESPADRPDSNSSSPPSSQSALPSTVSAMAAVSSLSSTLSSLPSLAGFMGRPAPAAADAPPQAQQPADEARVGVWSGGAFDKMPGRWNSAQVETTLVLHTASSVSLFTFPPSSGRAGPQLKEVFRFSADDVGGGAVVGARIVPPLTVSGTDWSLVVVTETTPDAGRPKMAVTLLSLPSLAPIASRSFAGSLADLKPASHLIAISTVHPSALHLLDPRTLEAVVPALVAPAVALDENRKPIFDVRGRLVAYASAESARKDGAPILRSSVGGRKLEEGVAGLSNLARSRRSDAASSAHPADAEQVDPTSVSASASGTSRRLSTTASSSARSVVVLAAADPANGSASRQLAHFSSRGVSTLSLSPSLSKLLVSTTAGHYSFSILALRPPGAVSSSSQTSLWETHVLHRGLTPARLEGVAWSDDEKWVASKTARGTTHVWLLDPGRPGLSDGRDVTVRIRQPPTPEGGLEIGFAFVATRGSKSATQDLVAFNSTDGQHISLHRLVPPREASVPKARPAPSPPSQGSALSLMISASRKAQALVAASTSSILDGGHGEGSQWEVARWEIGDLVEDVSSLPLSLLPAAEPRPSARDATALALSHAEIETSTPSLRIISGPLYLSHQFSFSTFQTTAIPAKVPLAVAETPTRRLVVRSEVVVSRSPALEPVPSLSSSTDSFYEPLSSAMGSPLGLHPRELSAKPVIPSYPNGDGLATSPRSWKSSAVGLPILVGARSLGDGLVRVRQEVNRITSPSGSYSSRQLRGRSSTGQPSSGGGGLSFEDGAVYDPSDFRQPSAGSDSFGPSSSSTDPGEPWEDDEDEAEEGYRALVAEEASFDDLVLGVMDEDDGRDVGAFQPRLVPRSTSILGLGPLSLKAADPEQLVPASLPVPLIAVPAEEVPAGNSDAPTKDQRKALNKARKRAARGSLSSPATPPSAASSIIIARSTSTPGHEDGSKHTHAV